MGALTRLSEHLYVFGDTCLVYLITDGDRGVLVDCGSGDVVHELPVDGVDRIDWVLQTHHHRDQCAGASRLIEHGAALAVPEREAHLFTAVEQFWESRQVTHGYDLATDWYTLAESVPVAALLSDYETFRWRRYIFKIVPAPGHTKGGIALVLEVDGCTVCFTGDLIAPGGRLPSVAALQWSYGGGVGVLDGVQPAAQALVELRSERPELLLPSHGQVIDQPEKMINTLISNLRSLVRFGEADAHELGMHSGPVGLVADRDLVQLSDHLWMNRYAFANSYFLVSESGNVLLMDYGFSTFHHFAAGFRFAEHSIHELLARSRARKIDLVIPSHYHDDHVAGIPHLQRHHGTRVWAHTVMADILEHPRAHRLPCLLPDPIALERVLQEGETFEWDGFTFTIVHTPGHTYYHSALCFEVDGLRVAHTGDTIHSGATGPILGGPIYHNRFRPGDFVSSIERLRAWRPQLILTGHTGAAEVDTGWFDIAESRARAGDARLTALRAPSCARFDLDPFWISLYPYERTVLPGEEFELATHVRNHDLDMALEIRMVVPDGWTVEPPEIMLQLPALAEITAAFRIGVPPRWPGSHPAVLCADVTVEDADGVRHLGQVSEAVVRRARLPGIPPYGVEDAALRGVSLAPTLTPEPRLKSTRPQDPPEESTRAQSWTAQAGAG